MTTNLLPHIPVPGRPAGALGRAAAGLSHEIRDELVRVLTARPAHFASNLGVVELTLALHLAFDFSKDKDRLIWDTGTRSTRRSSSPGGTTGSTPSAPRAG
jgi:1-deoxy-D-xylulose-5-phosphate synthase